MLIALDPVALNIGPLAVRWFGLLALVGLGLAIWRSLRALERARLPREVALDALVWALPVGLISARLVHLLGWWDYYLAHGSELWQLNLDGLSLWGGLVGGGLVFFTRCGSKVHAQRRRRMLDAVAPSVGLGIAVGRLGAFLDGHGQGLPSDLPWATQYANRLAATPDFGVPRQPAQLYDAIIALALWVLVSRLATRWPSGCRAAVFVVGYSAARVLLGAVRLDPAFLFGLQIEQILALGGLGFGLAYGLRPVLSRARHAPGRALALADRNRRRQAGRAEGVLLEATLYMKPDCHLCEAALGDLDTLQARYPHTLEMVDIDTDANLVRRYWDRIPVLHVGGREYDAPLSAAVLDRALQQAAADAATPPARQAAPSTPSPATPAPRQAAPSTSSPATPAPRQAAPSTPSPAMPPARQAAPSSSSPGHTTSQTGPAGPPVTEQVQAGPRLAESN